MYCLPHEYKIRDRITVGLCVLRSPVVLCLGNKYTGAEEYYVAGAERRFLIKKID